MQLKIQFSFKVRDGLAILVQVNVASHLKTDREQNRRE